MSEVANNQGIATAIEKPVQVDDVKFPPFPEPTEEEFEDDIGDDERTYYREKFSDLNILNSMKLHCTACDRHLGSSTKNESRMRAHPMLRTLVCHTCHTFYNSGEFEKGDDGSELYCRWCGQGGQVYCCSNCPHVFCAKCVKRNLGTPKIKEIENTDDWKCFKCNPRCLWDLRALCWALLRYCDLKNKITYKTEDPKLKEAYQKDCSTDHTECCKTKPRRREKSEKAIKKETDSAKKTNTAGTPRIPATIQVKKFASINLDDSPKEKKAQKRSASPPKTKPFYLKNPVTITQACSKIINPISMPPLKKIRMPVMTASMRMHQEKKPITYSPQASYARIRPRPPMAVPIMAPQFNGFPNNAFNSSPYNSMVVNDNINLSLESLTQGLDMAAVAAMSTNSNNINNDVVCTPDFPLEPLCEVTEDNTDDDIQCITPAPTAKPATNSAVQISRVANTLPNMSTENIIQMTDDDVTVNTVTGGLKFRVDPQTLSSNKMYRLPDGRIFAINANPSMPGGYSATIVAVTETPGKQVAPKGATYAAKLSAVTTPQSSTPKPTKQISHNQRVSAPKANILRKSLSSSNKSSSSARDCDMHVSVEWYRYNLIEAIDSLEYSLGRLEKLKKQATTTFLRQRTVEEMRNLHKTLERLLNTSSTRFLEIRDNLNKELKQYIIKKTGDTVSDDDDDDDDVEILPDVNDDPIYIDENSVDSTINECVENQEVDLTGVGSSDHNDSVENRNDDDRNNVEGTTTTQEGTNDDNVSSSSKNEIPQKGNIDKLDDPEDNNADNEKEKEVTPGPSLDDDNSMQSNEPESGDQTRTKGVSTETNGNMANTDDNMAKPDDNNANPDDYMANLNDNLENSVDNLTNHDDNMANPVDNKANPDDNNDEDKTQPDEVMPKEQEVFDSTHSQNLKDNHNNMETDSNLELENDKKSEEDQSKNVERELTDDVTDKESESKIQDSEMSEGMIENMLKGEDKSQDPDISEEMIEKLLKDDTVDEIDNILNNRAMDVV